MKREIRLRISALRFEVIRRGSSKIWDVFSEASYYPTAFSWQNEYDTVADLVSTLESHQNYSRVIGWHMSDEPYGGEDAENESPSFRTHIHDRLDTFKDEIEAELTVSRPIYLNLRNYGNYFGGSSNDVITAPNASWLDDLDIQDFIWDSSTYLSDFTNNWEEAVYVAESAIRYAISEGYGKGYARWAGCKDNVMTTSIPANLNDELYRYLAYSSWVAGGQGLLFFSYANSEAEKWFGDDSAPDGDEICAVIAEEAATMKDWLMDEPADNITATISDSQGDNDRLRFTLRRDQNGQDNRILLLFCNFNNDSSTHSTSIHFPNHTITNLDEVVVAHDGLFSLQDSNHTVYFSASSLDSTDVYGSACFLTLSQ